VTASGSSPATAAPVQSSIAARTLATWITLIATVGCVFAARALIARGLGPTGVGLFVLMLTAAFLGGTVLSVGLPAYNASFASKVSPAVLLSNSIAWNAVAAVVLAATCIPALLSPAIPLNWKMIILGVLMAPFTALLESTRGIFQGMSAMRPYNWLGLLSGLINVGAVSTLVATSRLNLETAVGCWVGGCLQAAGATVDFVGRPRVLDADRRLALEAAGNAGRGLALLRERVQCHHQPLRDRLDRHEQGE